MNNQDTQVAQSLRVAAVWGTTVMDLKTLSRGESFWLGETPGCVLPIPDGIEMSNAPLRSSQGGWDLDARGALGGVLRLRGRMEDVAGVARAGAPVAVMPGDFGLLQYGQFSVFFQYTAKPEIQSFFRGPDPLTILALISSGVLHFGVLGLVRTLMTPPPLGKPLELTSPEEYAARFGLHRPLVETPPPATPDPAATNAGGSGVKDPGAQDKKAQGGGQKMPGKEGKLGRNDKGDHTEIPGEIRPAQNLGGLTEVLEGDTGKEIKNTLKSIDTVASALSGLNSQNIVLGNGSGTSLKGGGGGGGGNSNGVAFGTGTLQTGWGAGNGGGYGSGSGGPGGRGSGGNGRGGSGGGTGTGNGTGNGNGEARVGAVGTPAATGGLSPEQIRRVVMAHVGAVRSCYDIELQKNPNLKGGMQIAWQIDPSGSVTSASVASSSLGNPRVEGCVVRQVKSWHFPESGAATNVSSYPFKFGVGG